MSKRNSNIVPLSTGRVQKHNLTHARRLIGIMTGDKTPEKTKRALRRALQHLFDQTNIGRRRSLTQINNVAAVLSCTGYQNIHLGQEYMRAFKARIAMCRVVEAHDWTTDPRLKRIAALMAERQRERLPRARRAERPRIVPAHRSPFAQQIAA